MSIAAPALDIQGLTHRFESGRVALREVTLRVEHGERVGIVGPNGAGKSTVLAYAAAALVPRQGTVSIYGERVTRRSARRARAHVGLVFQNPEDQLFMPTVRDDIAFGPLNLKMEPDAVRARIRESLADVALDESVLDRHPHQLSGGEQRSVALATVLALRPRLLALDEPTNDLDPRARRGLVAVLGELDRSLLVASHDLELILELCDRAILLDGGRVKADGPAAELLSDAALMDRHGLEVPRSLRPLSVTS